MTAVFAGTSYFLAFLGGKDQLHERAMAWSRALRGPFVTTEYVVVEVGNSLIHGDDRLLFVDFNSQLGTDTNWEIIPASTELLGRGVTLFAARPDQNWSLTDCTSFVIMTERGLVDSLSSDHDFEQAGFRALLRYQPDRS